MVYDIPRNFIGDTHWRESVDLHDGDELELEKGALVTVGESIGCIQQDLTAILERKKNVKIKTPERSATQRRFLPEVTQSSTGPLSTLRPKTLNALLGTPMKLHGRALLPIKSPYEERQDLHIKMLSGDRPFKRRRIDVQAAGAAPTRPIPQSTSGMPRLSAKGDLPVSSPLMSKLPATCQSNSSEAVINIESDEDDVQSKIPPSSPIYCSLSPKTNPPQSTTILDTAQKKSRNRSMEDPCAPTLSPPVNASPSKTNQSSRNSSSRSTDDNSERRMNPLRVASRKPRKKLMYKDLLPQRAPPLKPASIPGPNIGPPRTVRPRRDDPLDEESFDTFDTETFEEPFISDIVPKTKTAGNMVEAEPSIEPLTDVDPKPAFMESRNHNHPAGPDTNLARLDAILNPQANQLSKTHHPAPEFHPPTTAEQTSKSNESTDPRPQGANPPPSDQRKGSSLPQKQRPRSPLKNPPSKPSIQPAPLPSTTKIQPLHPPPATSSPSPRPTSNISAAAEKKSSHENGPSTAAAPIKTAPTATAKKKTDQRAQRGKDKRAEKGSGKGFVEEDKTDPSEPDLGPWSREAFDLFGFGRPEVAPTV
ncbi:hypothetical protein MMC09_003683 [Bachmanniomyces sp. S44760]|nr:hypothetical protein [Bachmanniomyces sp. S44760]